MTRWAEEVWFQTGSNGPYDDGQGSTSSDRIVTIMARDGPHHVTGKQKGWAAPRGCDS